MGKGYEQELNDLRKKIDEIDTQIVELIEKRFEIISKIAIIKKKNNLEVFDKSREESIINKIVEKSKKLPSYVLKDIYEKIFNVSRKFQEEIIKK